MTDKRKRVLRALGWGPHPEAGVWHDPNLDPVDWNAVPDPFTDAALIPAMWALLQERCESIELAWDAEDEPEKVCVIARQRNGGHVNDGVGIPWGPTIQAALAEAIYMMREGE